MKRFFDGDFETFVRDNKDLLIKVAAIALAVVAAFFLFLSREDEQQEVVMQSESAIEETTVSALHICVDIGGAVKNPKVVELPEGSRVEDAIEAAGGLTEDADLTDINRAAFLEDGEKVYIPEVYDEGEYGTAAPQGDGKININTADSEELQELDGVGPATAEKIIDYREENGRFSSIEDIKNVSGIGDKTFEKLKENIKV